MVQSYTKAPVARGSMLLASYSSSEAFIRHNDVQSAAFNPKLLLRLWSIIGVKPQPYQPY